MDNDFCSSGQPIPYLRYTWEPSRGPSLGLLIQGPTPGPLSFSMSFIFGANILGTSLPGFMMATVWPFPTVTGQAVRCFSITQALLEPGYTYVYAGMAL